MYLTFTFVVTINSLADNTRSHDMGVRQRGFHAHATRTSACSPIPRHEFLPATMDGESCGESPPFAALDVAADQHEEMLGATLDSDDIGTCILPSDHMHLVADDAHNSDDHLPFALPHGGGLSESFLKTNEALGLSLAATTISTRSAGSDDDQCHLQSPASGDTFYGTPRSHAHDEQSTTLPSDSIASTSIDGSTSPPYSQQQDASKSSYRPSYKDDDRPSPAAAAAAEAAAALYRASAPPLPASSSSSSSFILQYPTSTMEHDESCENKMTHVHMKRRDDIYVCQSTTSLEFSDLMRKAEGGGGATDGGDSFALVSSPLHPVLEATPSREESKGGDDDGDDDRATLTSTPLMSNVGIGGATIVPPAPLPVPLHAAPTSVPVPPRHRQRPRRLSPYRTMGPSVHTTQLSEDSFSVSTHILPPCSVREVIDVLANPDLLRLWCAPVKNAIITSEGLGHSGSSSREGSADGGRDYDGEWVEITTPQLVSPSSSCSACLYSGLTAAKAALGFQTEGYVKMFVERSRGQVGLSIGPFMGGMVADHTITVGDNCALMDSSSGVAGGENASSPSSTQSNGGVVITDTVRVRKDEDLAAAEEGYSCGLFGVLERYALPSISGYMTQAALSLENLCDVVCDGEACAYAGTCSVDFSEDRGLGDDGCDGRTPLLS